MFSYIFVKEFLILDSKGKGAAQYCILFRVEQNQLKIYRAGMVKKITGQVLIM